MHEASFARGFKEQALIQGRSFITILGWPTGAAAPLREEIVRSFLGVDGHRARELARRPMPAIVARAPAGRGERIAAELTDAGVPSVAVPGDAIAAHAKAWLACAIGSAGGEGRLTVERCPNGREDKELSVEFPSKSIILMVRGACRDKVTAPGGDFGVEALHQLHGTFSAEDWSQGHAARGRLRVVEALDVHTLEGTHWRFLGGRFACGLPGVQGGDPTARGQIDRLAAALERESGGPPIDRSFAAAGFLAEFAPDFGVRGDWRSLAGFGVYSAWRRYLAMHGRATGAPPLEPARYRPRKPLPAEKGTPDE
jgi:hypothetical protein